MKVHPYLNFDGKAEEAFMFYKSVFGGEFKANMKMKEMPEGNKLSIQEQNRTMHIALPIGEGTLLMASDIVPSEGHKMVFGNQTHIMLSPETKEEAINNVPSPIGNAICIVRFCSSGNLLPSGISDIFIFAKNSPPKTDL